jgi:5-methylcytosine-specific restriction endonuclease McrA
MRQHHTKVHDQLLPNRECKGCGLDFYDEKAKQSFCDDCNPNAGEHNGNWCNAKKETECKRCGNSFEYYPSNKKGIFCPSCVEAADEFLGTSFADVVDAERIEKRCEFCEDDFELLASDHRRGAGRFCSRDCLANWMSENRVGENHHQWIDGSGTYTGTWWSARRQALRRDDFKCQNCGKASDEIGRKPDVHYIIPARLFNDPEDAHHLSNLIALCRSCHRQVEEGNIAVPKSGNGKFQR